MSEQFTIVEYLYRDASNYKAFGAVALPGALTEEQIDAFREDYVDNDFLPAQVGLPALQSELLAHGGSDGEDDHIWHEITDIRVEDNASDATHQPLRPMTAAEFVAQFDGIDWDESAAIAALDDLLGNY